MKPCQKCIINTTTETVEIREVEKSLGQKLTEIIRKDTNRLERIATAVLSGIWANTIHTQEAYSSSFAVMAVDSADALIAEIDKKKKIT